MIHGERPIFWKVIVSVIVAKSSHELVFFDLSSAITQHVNGQALHFMTKITLVVIKMVNKSFEDAVRFNMFESDIAAKRCEN